MNAIISKSTCGSQNNTKLFPTIKNLPQIFGTKTKLRWLTIKDEATDLDRLESGHIIICKLLQNVSSSKPKGA